MKRNEATDPDVLMITFDALRFDVADAAFREGLIPNLQARLPDGWERRHTPATFTYAAHAAFFAGFFPTPTDPWSAGSEPRPFALRFHGSRTIGPNTQLLDGETIVEGLQQRGYHTVCIGGVGFFNCLNPLGSVFPKLFDESHWEPSFGVSELHSTRRQVQRAVETIDGIASDRPLFLFVNVSATHAPTHFYLRDGGGESVDSQKAALRYVDRELPPLFDALSRRNRPGRAFLMSDHGALFGEDGFTGHRVAHPHVWHVPYAETGWGGKAC